jgi:hypothetical protein
MPSAWSSDRKPTHEVLERAAEPVDGPGHDHPEVPTRGIFAKRVERWSVLSRLCSAYTFVAVELHDLPTHASGLRIPVNFP